MPEKTEERPTPRRSWRHARYGDAPAPAQPGPRDKTFDEEEDAARTGDVRPPKH